MKKLTLGILAFFCMMLSVMAYTYENLTAEKMEKMMATQLRLAILERYDNAEDLKAIIITVFESGSTKLQNRFALALQQVFTSKAAVSAAARKATADYVLELMTDTGAKAYTAADGSYRVEVGNSKPTYQDDDDYKRISEPPISF